MSSFQDMTIEPASLISPGSTANRRFGSPLLVRLTAAARAFALLLLVSPAALAAGDFMTFRHSLMGSNFGVSFDLRQDTTSYYILQESTNLPVFTPSRMYLFGGSNIWDFSVSLQQKPILFWRTQRVPVGIPLDTVYTSKNGRPIKIANSGNAIKQLIG